MYASQDDLVGRFGEPELIQLTDRADPPAGAIDATVVAKALADADELINGYLAGGGVALPLASTPEIVKRLACDVARYFLSAAQPTETVRQNYEDALKTLRMIADGTMKLQVAGAVADGNESLAEISGEDRRLSRTTLKGF